MSATIIQFDLARFDVDVSDRGVYFPGQYSWGANSTDAVAVLEIKIDDISSIFQFQTRRFSLSSLVKGPQCATEQIEYFVHSSKWSDIKLMNARLNHPCSKNPVLVRNQYGQLYPDDEMTIAYDYLRHIATYLFNTPYGYRLFWNQSAIIDEVESLSQTVVMKSLLYIDDGHPPTTTTTSTEIVDDDTARFMVKNLSYVLMKQIAAQDPARFLEIPDSNVPHALPFRPNDSFCIRLTLHTPPTQHEIVPTRHKEIPPKTYFVKLLLVD